MSKKSFAKYLLAIVCVLLGVMTIFISPDLYKMFHLNIGPSIAFGFAIAGTLALDAAEKA